jgi:RNA polymerase sigma-70 factor (ECF subfamily)
LSDETVLEMVKEAQRGNTQAFTDLFLMHQELIYSIAFTYVKNEDSALDVVQETAYKSYLKLNKLKNPEHFKAWICKTTINNSIDFLRKNQKYVLECDINDTSVVQSDNEMLFLDMLICLEEKEKSVIYYKIYFDYTFEQVSKVMKITVNSIKTIYYRAIEKLKAREELLL